MTIAQPSGVVDLPALRQIRPHLEAAGASTACDAADTYEYVHTFHRQALAEGHAAHETPRRLRQAHREAVITALLDRSEPDDGDAWASVIYADRALDRQQARYSAAQAALTRAGRRLHEALGVAETWQAVLPHLARHRAAQDDPVLATLADAITWPAIVSAPGVETRNTLPSMRFSAWWPLSFAPLTHSRAERISWEEWCWEQIAAGDCTVTDDSIAFGGEWAPPHLSPFTEDDQRSRLQPVIVVDDARRNEYALSLELQR